MDPSQLRSDRMFLVLAQHYHQDDLNALTSFLDPKLQQALQKEPPVTCESLPVLCEHPAEFLESIHYSWFKPVLQQLSLPLLQMTIAALSENKQEGLSKVMSWATPTHSPSPLIKKFLLRRLWKKIHPPHLLPQALLPNTPFLPFLNKNKKTLMDIIDLLGLYDIAEEILQIVDKKSLKTLYDCLSPLRRSFLKKCLQQKERVSISKVGLEHWNGDKTKLDQALHRRGLFRLGKALYGEHPDFIWYIVHTLDVGRGEILFRLSQEKGKDRVLELLKNQCLTVMHFLGSKNP